MKVGVVLFFILPGCARNKILNEDKFMKVYVDLMVAQDTANIPISKFDSLKAIVFNHNGITGKEYSATINYYNSEPERWQKFFLKTTQYVDNLRRKSLIPPKKTSK